MRLYVSIFFCLAFSYLGTYSQDIDFQVSFDDHLFECTDLDYNWFDCHNVIGILSDLDSIYPYAGHIRSSSVDDSYLLSNNVMLEGAYRFEYMHLGILELTSNNFPEGVLVDITNNTPVVFLFGFTNWENYYGLEFALVESGTANWKLLKVENGLRTVTETIFYTVETNNLYKIVLELDCRDNLQIICNDDLILETAIENYKSHGKFGFLWPAGDNVNNNVFTSISYSQNDFEYIEDNVCTEHHSPFNVPNAISPNHDGLNDSFRPILKEMYEQSLESYNLKIYNRYGNLVFETDMKSEGFYPLDKVLPNSVLTFLLEYKMTGDSVQHQKGNFLIIK